MLCDSAALYNQYGYMCIYHRVLSFSPQILPFSLTFSVIILLLSLSLHKPTELGLQDVVDNSEMFIVYTWV